MATSEQIKAAVRRCARRGKKTAAAILYCAHTNLHRRKITISTSQQSTLLSVAAARAAKKRKRR